MIKEAIKKYNISHSQSIKSLKAVLIDMDGVLYDSMKNHAKSWYVTMQSQGINSTEDEFYMYEGRTGASTINLLFEREKGRKATEQEKKDIYRLKTENFCRFPPAPPMPGALDFLENVKSKGITPVLVTGSGQVSLLEKLNHDYHGIFTPNHMVTAFDVKHGKPNPEPYLMGLKKAGVTASEAIVVENAPLGVEAGVAAGIFTVAVNTGPLSDQILLDAGADLLLPSMQKLADYFDELFNAIKDSENH
ncbi:HAD-IA family hydrolase [Coprobacter tertius]|uniref:HAD-IA family hydrolase n=1 Tax=Coprobacter tertius TaxID=2944915 RepID=A0ABT1MI04_9BACT|nr:HAD-IA family hydrolase [Coprobacter tertius]MCP9612268.1 HAD-IA family hydrolase [Coprobacter tertius]